MWGRRSCRGDLGSAYDSIFFAVYGVALTAVGALVVSRLPRHPVGWILCLGGLLDAVTVQLATGWGLRVSREAHVGDPRALDLSGIKPAAEGPIGCDPSYCSP